MKIYLAHSVHERKLGLAIQNCLESIGYEVLNPFYPDKKPRQDIEDLDKGKIVPWTGVDKETATKITDEDLEAVRKSDIIVAVLPEPCITIGIPMEMMFAAIIGIPIIVITNTMGGHPWIVRYAREVYKSPVDFLREVRKQWLV